MRELLIAPWRFDFEREAYALAEGQLVDGDAFNAAVNWVVDLPASMPRPQIGLGEDGSVSVEWDRAGNALHVRFEASAAEVYFASDAGDEFETDLGAGQDKIAAALRTIALAR
jgi:hypothetical protein